MEAKRKISIAMSLHKAPSSSERLHKLEHKKSRTKKGTHTAQSLLTPPELHPALIYFFPPGGVYVPCPLGEL